MGLEFFRTERSAEKEPVLFGSLLFEQCKTDDKTDDRRSTIDDCHVSCGATVSPHLVTHWKRDDDSFTGCD